MSIDYTATTSDLYTRVTTGSAGATVRGLVGSIFEALDPLNLNGKTLPYLMWRSRTVGGASGEMRDVAGSWFAYINATDNPRTLRTIASALEALYGTQGTLALAGGRLSVSYVGAPFWDAALGLRGLEVRIGYRRLG